ncbi:MAG: 23S rRNA (adenine(2503)-C(2))-methyltransferase RlmN [bacterium]|nr:MAG: 23S rRNA (adenine(2503)-C(2))-methyltransferase RlmN [bacterium]
MKKRNIKALSITELASAITGLDEQRHRSDQILQWLYQKGVTRFDRMTNLSLELRRLLDKRFVISSLEQIEETHSNRDQSAKYLLRSEAGTLIETVLMESRGYQTICISSQVGCPLRCSFCRTGTGGFERNLRSDEILNQVLHLKMNRIEPRHRFNIVFMGMGEPLLNLENVTKALEILNSQHAFALAQKRITLSTIGFPDIIERLTASPLKFGLAISLNATTDRSRRKLMPQAAGIGETLQAAESFARNRRMRATLEYVLLSGVNDRPEDARRLADMTHGRPFKINLIPFNEWDGAPFKRPTEARIDRFVKILLPRAPAVTVRRSQGTDIDAACGQLRMRRERCRD